MVQQALQNTVMGIGIVFTMLVLISLLIYCFKFIKMIQDRIDEKNRPPVDEKFLEELVDIRLLVPAPTEDERELVAVISAAIAASEQISTDDFIVRSIRRRY